MNKIAYVILDADNLINKLVYKDNNNIELVSGTKKFIVELYDILECYRKSNNIDEIVLSLSTIKDYRFLNIFERLFYGLNSNECIKYGSGYCYCDGKRIMMPENSFWKSEYTVSEYAGNNYTINDYYKDLNYLGLSNVIIIGDDTYYDFYKNFKSIYDEYHLANVRNESRPIISHILLEDICLSNEYGVEFNRNKVIDGVMMSSYVSASGCNKINIDTINSLNNSCDVNFYEGDEKIIKVKKLDKK